MFEPLNTNASKKQIIKALNEVLEVIDEWRKQEISRLIKENEQLKQQQFAQSEIKRIIERI